MKATLAGELIAESEDIVAAGGYDYFPRSSVRMERLEKAEKTRSDRECPHGVQFYDVVIGGKRYPRAAWVYEQPLPRLAQVKDRFGFWNEVEVV